MAAISEYDQVLYEDNKTSRISEAVKLFDEISNSQWFAKTSIVLFLNKNDLFVQKLWRVPYRLPGVRNDDFQGPYAEDENAVREEVIEAAQKHTLEKFLKVRRDAEKRQVYHHITCATDTKNVQVVFNACKDIILRSNLLESGFMQ